MQLLVCRRFHILTHSDNVNPFPGSYVNSRTEMSMQPISMGNQTRYEIDTKYLTEPDSVVSVHLTLTTSCCCSSLVLRNLCQEWRCTECQTCFPLQSSRPLRFVFWFSASSCSFVPMPWKRFNRPHSCTFACTSDGFGLQEGMQAVFQKFQETILQNLQRWADEQAAQSSQPASPQQMSGGTNFDTAFGQQQQWQQHFQQQQQQQQQRMGENWQMHMQHAQMQQAQQTHDQQLQQRLQQQLPPPSMAMPDNWQSVANRARHRQGSSSQQQQQQQQQQYFAAQQQLLQNAAKKGMHSGSSGQGSSHADS